MRFRGSQPPQRAPRLEPHRPGCTGRRQGEPDQKERSGWRHEADFSNFGNGVCKTKGKRNRTWYCTLVGEVVSHGVRVNNSEVTRYVHAGIGQLSKGVAGTMFLCVGV